MASITVVINKVAIQSDLYIIENYIKKVDNINVKIVDGRLRLFLFSLFYFIFLCLLISIFYFQNNLG